jgi:arylsulfatase A-like enzyme/tetratricopeptide (TPR) repeat protein
MLGALAFSFLGPSVQRRRGLSVLLITVDTLRVDALGAYGRARSPTPSMDHLAAGGARFEAAHAQNVVTLPSHANLLSGRYSLEHGIRDNSGFRFPAATPTLATILKGAGYRTGAFVSAFPLDARFGLGRGFDLYDDRFGTTDGQAAFHMQERRAVDTVAAARRWLEADPGVPTFCWVHVYEPHFPYEPIEPFASRFPQEPYLGEVAAADDALRPLLEPLLKAGKAGRTLVVLTADHGESLGEHGEMTHGIFAYEATLHVPLIVFAPALFAPRVVGESVRHVDVLPTILDALEIPSPAGLPGTSLLPLAAGAGGASARSSYFEALSGFLNRGWAPLRGVVKGREKYIDLPVPELYDLAADPHETHNLAAAHPARLEEMKALLGGLRSGERDLLRVAESAEAREALRALGYVASSSTSIGREASGVEDDPKNLIALDAEVQGLVDRYQKGDLEGAIRTGEALLRKRPMPLVYTHLAFLYRQKGDLRAAVEAVRQALALKPDDTDAASLLGGYLVEAGRPKEAVRVLAPYAGRAEPDPDVLTARGMALAALGETKEALATFERARGISPGNPMNLVNIGTTHLMAGDLVHAREAFLAAIDISPDFARAHNNLGVIAAREGRLEEAVARWRRALALDPSDFQTLFNLATILRRQGNDADARPLLERYVKVAPPSEARDVAAARAWLGRGSPEHP